MRHFFAVHSSFLIFMIFCIMQGCASTKKPIPVTAKISRISGHFRIGQIVELKRGTVLPFEKFIDEIASKEIIFLGEVHDNPEHHLIQLQILQALMDAHGPLSIAMESFQKPQQPLIDQYLKGDLTESNFLKKVNWRRAWGIDYHLYRPLLLAAKSHKSEVLAINAPYGIVKKIARHGLKSLDETERESLAKEIDLTNKAHRAYLRNAFKQHKHKELKKFEYFYEAQCVWEDTMAENLAEHLNQNRRKLVVIVGNGHIINRFGIPDRVLKRSPVSMITVMPYPLHEDVVLKKEMADYVWLTPNYSRRFKMFEGS